MITGYLLISSIVAALLGTIFLRYRRRVKSWDTWLIKKGRHYSKRNFSLFPYKFGLAPKALKFQVVFGKGCDYEDNSDGDINKLYGVSYGVDNHWRSVRIGWNYNANLKVIQLYSYAYIKGKRKITPLVKVVLGETYYIQMIHYEKGNQVIIKIEDAYIGRPVTHVEHGIDKSWIRLKQFPFFGGDHVAPNDMRIHIKEA